MKKEKPNPGLYPTLFATLVLIFLPITMLDHAHAGRPVMLSRNDLRVSTVTIDNMADKYNFIFVGERRFRVSPTAAILDYSGKSIPLGFLPIPCRAKMTYHLFGDNRDPLVIKIQLR